MKRYEIYKIDKWNMMFVEEIGRRLIVTEISTQWGEETHEFMSRGELERWAVKRFNEIDFQNRKEEAQLYLERIREI